MALCNCFHLLLLRYLLESYGNLHSKCGVNKECTLTTIVCRCERIQNIKIYFARMIVKNMITTTEKNKDLLFFLVLRQHFCIKLVEFLRLRIKDLFPYVLGKVPNAKGKCCNWYLSNLQIRFFILSSNREEPTTQLFLVWYYSANKSLSSCEQ